MQAGEKRQEKGKAVCLVLPRHFSPSGLRLTSNCIHNGVLRVHANRSVVLGMDDGGLASWPLHFNGLVGGKSRVLQGNGVETGHVLIAVVVELVGCREKEKEREERGMKWGKGGETCCSDGQKVRHAGLRS